ncbi:MAG: hypothetical protein FWD61_02655 [Phycisphaerales bacterium]|nr:hypothetical protein [Phycisphaerales bacterium]
MLDFIQGRAQQVTGIIHGWDRLRFRGTVRLLAHTVGLGRFLRFTGCLLKDFGDRALELSRQVRSESLAVAEQAGRPVVHLSDPGVHKEDVAREMATRDGIKTGLIGTLTAVEPCWSFDIRISPCASVAIHVVDLTGQRGLRFRAATVRERPGGIASKTRVAPLRSRL